MRLVRLLAVFALAEGVCALRAEPAPDSDNPAAYDPDSTPRAYTEKPKQDTHPSADRVAAQQEQAQEKNDWLLRAYEEQLQARSLADGQSQSNNLYTEITSNPDLAKAAGLAPVTPAATPAAADLRAGTGNGSPGLTLRSDSSSPGSTQNVSAKPPDSTFNPILAPLDSSEAEALHSLFTSLPVLSPDPASARLDPDATDPGALDIPGMTAAESDPTKKADLDLTLDPLPGEQDAATRPHDLALAMPTRDSEQVQREQAAATLAPGQHKTAPPAPINPLLLKETPDDTSHMVPDPPPIRGQVDDPYDILR
jgi:hypothetical protein